MRIPIVKGVGVLGLLWVIGAGESLAQVGSSGAGNAYPPTSIPLPYRTQAPRPQSRGAVSARPVLTSMVQDPPNPSPTTPA
ncbi:hypothetical protein ACYOEI_25700, partial [Singulisphaera rosea]